MAMYAKPLGVDQNNNVNQDGQSPFKALARYDYENGVASSVITMTDQTTVLEVAALAQAAVLRWVPTTDTQASVISAATTANYDHVIPQNTYRRFIVPIETMGTGTQSIQGINRQLGLYQRYAIKTTGIGSVLTAEF